MFSLVWVLSRIYKIIAAIAQRRIAEIEARGEKATREHVQGHLNKIKAITTGKGQREKSITKVWNATNSLSNTFLAFENYNWLCNLVMMVLDFYFSYKTTPKSPIRCAPNRDNDRPSATKTSRKVLQTIKVGGSQH